MSRNNSTVAAQRLPPSHPMEQYEEHRAFLLRSLERNDKEIAALVDLTRSIRSVKQEIIDHCGELTLLDLGSGKIRLAPSGDGLEIEDNDYHGGHDDTPAHLDTRARELCVDFLLRLKLRRKLLSRLFRRVNRVAHAMDGIDVSPPALPKYGDLRLHIEPGEVEVFQERWERQEKAQSMIEKLREDSHVLECSKDAATLATDKRLSASGDSEMVVTEPNVTPAQQASSDKPEIDYGALMSFKDGYKKLVHPETGDFRYTIFDSPHEEDYVKIKLGTGIGAAQRAMTVKEKEIEFNRWRTAVLSRIPEQPTYAELGLEHRVFYEGERRKRALEAVKEIPSKKRRFADDDDDRPEKGRGGKSLRKLQEEKDAKDKKNEAGSDPTDNVEMVDDNKTKEDGDDGDLEQKEGAESQKEGGDPFSPQTPVEQSSTETEIKEVDAENPVIKAEVASQDDEVVDNTEEPHIVKRTNPISLGPVPSFYEQDLKRIRMIQGELLTASRQSYARQRLEDVIKDYNRVLRASQETSQRRHQIDTKLQQVIFDSKREQADQQKKISAARGEWLKRLQTFNNEKLNKTLKSRWNQASQGTAYISHYGSSSPDPIRKEVSLCTADLVDSVELIAEGKLANPIFNEPFVPPPDSLDKDVDPATGETLGQQRQRIHQLLRKESDTLAQQYRQFEEDRQRAWKRMLKVKAELNIPQTIYSNQRPVQIPLSDQNYHMMAMPSQAAAMMEYMPRELDISRSALPSYVPTHQERIPDSTTSGAGSKYTVARVRARISADGSVAPVNLPTKGADGLYPRPSGRTRQGMIWDGVNGKWIPEST